MKEITAASTLLTKLRIRFGVDEHKIHVMGLVARCWERGESVKVMELIKMYKRTSTATTHKAVQELVSNRLIKKQPSKEDKRVVYIVPGMQMKNYIKVLREAK